MALPTLAGLAGQLQQGKADVTQLVGQLQAMMAVSESADDPPAGNLSLTGVAAIANPTQDPLGFTLQIGSLLFGPSFVEDKLNGLLRKLAGTADKPGALETQLKDGLYRMCVSGLGDQLIPPAFATEGYVLPVRLLDLFDVLRIEPASEEGRVAQSDFERALILNVLRRPGVAYQLPDLPYLSLRTDAAGQTVTIRFNAAGGTSPAPTRLVDLFADLIYHPKFRLLDPARISLDVLDLVLGISARVRSSRALEREHWLGQVVGTLSSETQSETLFDFSAPALVQVRAAVSRQQAGISVDTGCEPEARTIPAASVVVPLVVGTAEPDLALAYHQLLNTHLVSSTSPGAAVDTPLRDSLSRGLAKALVLVLARNTVLAPRVWTLLMLSRLFRVGYQPTELAKYVSSGVNEADFKGLLTEVRPLIETSVKLLIKAGVIYLSDALLKKLRRFLAPLIRRIAGEQGAAYLAVLDSLLPVGASALSTLF